MLSQHKGTQAMDVVAVCSGRHAETVKRLGASAVVDPSHATHAMSTHAEPSGAGGARQFVM